MGLFDYYSLPGAETFMFKEEVAALTLVDALRLR
jgi:hypothetical protein